MKRLLLLCSALVAACAHVPETKAPPNEQTTAPVAPTAAPMAAAKLKPLPEVTAPTAKAAFVTAPIPAGDAKPADSAKPKVSEAAVGKARDLFVAAQKKASDGNQDGAITVFEEAFLANPQNAWPLYNIGVIYERRGDNAKAQVAYARALDARPDFDEAAANLTHLRVRTGQQVLAEQDLRDRIGKNPAALALRTHYVDVLIALGRFDLAEVEAKRVLKADEQNTSAMHNLAVLWLKQKKYELARDILAENAIRIRPGDAGLYNTLGFIYLALKQKPMAIEAFKKAASLRDDFPEAHINLGVFYNEASAWPDAIRELELAAKYAADWPSVHLNLGNAYRGNKDYPKAVAEYQRVMQLAPQNPDPLFNLGVLYLDGDMKDKTVLDRIALAQNYFQQFKQAGGADPHFDAYFDSASKAQKKEVARIESDKQRAVKAEASAKKKKEDAEKKAVADKAAAERLQKGKLGGADDDAPKAAVAGKPALGKISEAEEAVTPKSAKPAATGKLGGEDEK